MPRIALTNELPELPDGTYAIGIAGFPVVRFQVHTVTMGTLAGQRIVKYRRVDGSFKGFAFIKVEESRFDLLRYDGIQIWRSQQGNVTESYARNVSQAIRRFIARVYDEQEDLSDFIVIEECPDFPDRVRMQLSHRLNAHTADDPVPEQRSWTPTRGLRPIRERNNAAYQRQTSTFAHLNSEPEEMDSRQSPPLRVTRLAMSCFHPEEVR